MMRYFILMALFVVSTIVSAQSLKISPKDLEEWQSVGEGKGYVTHGQFMMEEVEGSKGFMLLSPNKYNDVILRYEAMTMNPATVLVAIINASDIGPSSMLTVRENSDSFGFWTKEVEDYMFGFRVMAHNSTPFLRKHPVTGGNAIIGLAKKNVMHSGWRHLIECGKRGQHLWLKIDGETIIDVQDKQPLDAGKIAIRVRGTGSDLGKFMLRNLEIEGTPVK